MLTKALMSVHLQEGLLKLTVLLLLCSLGTAGVAGATTITFAPPNDAGHVFSTNTNDVWATGRGMVFQMAGDVTINSAGVLQDLTAIQLSYAIYQVAGATGDVRTNQVLLRSGGALTTTSGLQYVDFSFAPLNLAAGNFYHLEITFTGNSNRNFFYNNNNIAWSQTVFSLLDGTQGGDTSNIVVGAFRFEVVPAAISGAPEPATLTLALCGFGVAAWYRLRRR